MGKYSIDTNQFIEKESLTKESCYALGLIWADGTLSKDSTVTLTCVTEDLEQVTPVFQKTGNWAVYYRYHNKENRKPQQTFSIKDAKLYEFLENKGYKAKSGKSARLILDFIPKALQKYWWRGYFDGDGCIYIDKNYQLFFTSCVDQEWDFVKEHFSNFKWKEIRKYTDKGNYSRILCARKQEIISILSIIYDDFSENRVGFERKHSKLTTLLTPKIYRFQGKGYSLHKPSGRWRIKFSFNTSVINGGYVSSEEEAIEKVKTLRDSLLHSI